VFFIGNHGNPKPGWPGSGLWGAWLLFAFSLTGCALLFHTERAQTPPVFYKSDFNPPDPSDDQEDESSLRQALDSLAAYYADRNPERVFRLGDRACDAQALRETVANLRESLAAHGLSRNFFDAVQRDCDAYVPVASAVQVTAYCTPKLRGSYVATTRYAHPLYRLPDDLIVAESRNGGRRKVRRLDHENQLVPYYTREEIDYQGALKNRDCELLWVDSPADAYFLQIEGSGLVQLESGDCIQVMYAGVNGHPCRMIGRYLREKKRLTPRQLSIPGIRRYLHANPDELREILASDPSYVFFKTTNSKRAWGCYGLPLIPFRAIAADRRYFPPGIPAYLEMTIPVFRNDGEGTPLRVVGRRRYRGLVFNCDTGGMIRGPARIDWYTGAGELAEAMAGHLCTKARLCLLLRKKGKSAGLVPG